MRHKRISGHRRYWILSLLALLLLAPQWVPGAVAAGQSAQHGSTRSHSQTGDVGADARHQKSSNLVVFSSLGWTAQSVSGSNSTLDLYIPGPGDVVFGQAARLSLVYSGSPALDARRSWVSVSVNNTYVWSHLIRGGSAGPATLNVHIPPSILIGNGYNHLQLSFGLRDTSSAGGVASSGACANNTNLTATVYGTSSLAYDVRGRDQSAFQPDLAQLPAPFVSSGASVAARIAVGLPAAPTEVELTGGGQVVARFGEDAPAQPPTVTTTLAASLPRQAPLGTVLLIGTPRDNPVIARLAPTGPVLYIGEQWRDAEGRALPPDAGLVVETPNPWDPHGAVLMVTANGQEGIRRAAMVLGSASLRGLLHGSFALIPTEPALRPTPPLSQGTLTLDELGYQSPTLEGSGEHTTHVNFDLRRLPATDGAFTLVYGHGANVDPVTSSVRVDLNGHPLASRPLGSGDPPRARWRIPLPADQLRLGTNVLTVRFFLGALGTTCFTPPSSSLWGVVDTSSILTLPSSRDSGSPDLSLLPYPLLVDGDPRGTILVAPATVAGMRDTFNLAALLGAQSNVDAPRFTILAADRATPDRLRGHTVVLDDVPPVDPLVRHIQSSLPLRVGAPGAALQLTGAFAAVAREQSNVGVVEELPSPWDATQAAVFVSASQPALLPAAQRALFEGALNGTVATVDAAGRLQTFDSRAPAATTTAGTAAPPARPIRLLGFTGFGLLLFVFGATAVRGARREGGLL